jgi:hypothetical protein
LRCKLGLHRWPTNGTTMWLDKPTFTENRYGSAMEYRACEGCGKLRDITTWFDVPDPDFGVPQKIGPLVWARMQEVMRGPRVPLPCPPIPWSDDA